MSLNGPIRPNMHNRPIMMSTGVEAPVSSLSSWRITAKNLDNSARQDRNKNAENRASPPRARHSPKARADSRKARSYATAARLRFQASPKSAKRRRMECVIHYYADKGVIPARNAA